MSKIKGWIENEFTKYYVKVNIYHVVIFIQERIDKKKCSIYSSRIAMFDFNLLNVDRKLMKKGICSKLIIIKI